MMAKRVSAAFQSWTGIVHFLAMLLRLPALQLPLAEFFDDFSLFGSLGEGGAGLIDLALDEGHFLGDGEGFALDRTGEAAMSGQEGHIKGSGQAVLPQIGDSAAGDLVEIGKIVS